MQEKGSRGMRLELAGNKLIVDAEITINWKKIFISVTTLLIIILIITSSLNADVKNILLEVLLNSLQMVFIQKTKLQ